jgi:hypothetical protein
VSHIIIIITPDEGSLGGGGPGSGLEFIIIINSPNPDPSPGHTPPVQTRSIPANNSEYPNHLVQTDDSGS